MSGASNSKLTSDSESRAMLDLFAEEKMTPKEVAEWAGVHRRTVDAWFKSGLEHVKLGALIYTTKQAINRFGKYGVHSEDTPSVREAMASSKRLREEFGLNLKK